MKQYTIEAPDIPGLGTALQHIVSELSRAIEKHPLWPDDAVHAAAIVGEESGELTRAALHYVYEGGFEAPMLSECTQVGAMAIRFIIHYLQSGKYNSDKPQCIRTKLITP